MELRQTMAPVKIVGASSSNESVQVSVSPDSQELSLLFNDFSTTNGPASDRIWITLEVPMGYQFSLYHLDYRGFVAANTRANLQVEYAFAGYSRAVSQQTFLAEDDYTLSDNLVTLSDIQLPHGEPVILQIDLALRATGPGIATIDSLDLAYQGNVYYPTSPPLEEAPKNNAPELFDFRSSATNIQATFSIYREADYNNTVYLYPVQDETGMIFDAASQQFLTPTDTNYLQIALRNAVSDVALNTPQQTTTTINTILSKGILFAPAIVINSDRATLFDTNPNNDPTVYTPFVLGNADRLDHILRLSDHSLVFEDLAGGGDLDYNDIILTTTFQPIL